MPHLTYEREGNNLVLNRTMNLCDALTGVGLQIDTLDDRRFRIYVVHIVEPGYEKVIPGEGMPVLGDPGENSDNFCTMHDMV